MPSSARHLEVYRDSQLVGTLYDEQPLKFSYAESWLSRNSAKPIAPSIGLDKKTHSGEMVEAYFENLLPEASIREGLKVKHQVTSVFGLLGVVGGDTAGALSLFYPDTQIESPQYTPTTWEAIRDQLRTSDRLIQDGPLNRGLRISLAGAQRKEGIFLMPDGTPAIPRTEGAPVSHILKPDILGIDGVWLSALNESFTMQLAKSITMDVAEAQYQPIAKACLIKRYDRIWSNDHQLIKLHQQDLCQLDGKKSDVKYENDNGPSLKRCRELLQESGVPGKDLVRLIQWVFFNLFVGNNDSHAKNLSIYYLPNGDIRLTPFYDLLSTTIYGPHLSKNFAFKIGGTFNPAEIDKEAITKMSDDLGFKPKYVLTQGEKLADKLLNDIDKVTDTLATIANERSEPTMLEKLNRDIKHSTKKFQRTLFS